MKILSAEKRHVPRIAEIETQCFADPWPAEQIERLLTDGGHVFLVAEEAGETLGYISLMYVLDEGYIGNVAVAPEARRCGLGRALVEEMTARAKDLELAFLTLEVRESNLPARALYTQCGYRGVGLRKNYYEKPRENALLMTLELNT